MTKIALTCLFISLALCGYLWFENSGLRAEISYCSESEDSLIEERHFLLELIPELEPEIKKSRLTALIKGQYPGEPVNEGEHYVQWRFFYFWFNKEGKLERVQYGS